MAAKKVEALIQAIKQLSPADRENVLKAILKSLQTEAKMQSLADLEARYPNEWLAIIVPEGEDRYHPQRGYLITHGPDRAAVWQQVADLPMSEAVYVFFNGPVAAKGFGMTFHDPTDTPVVASMGD